MSELGHYWMYDDRLRVFLSTGREVSLSWDEAHEMLQLLGGVSLLKTHQRSDSATTGTAAEGRDGASGSI